MADFDPVYRSVYGTEGDRVLVLQTGPYCVEESPAGEHFISRRGGNPDLEFGRRPLTRDDIAILRACYLDGRGNNPKPEVVAYFDGELASLKAAD